MTELRWCSRCLHKHYGRGPRGCEPRLPFGASDLAALWIRAGGDPARARLAGAVALAESAGIAEAVGPDDRVGLWQPPQWAGPIGQRAPAPQLLDPLTNAEVTVIQTRNGADWSSFPGYVNGAYLAFGGAA